MPKGTFWTAEDDRILRQLCAKNLSTKEIMVRMRRSKNAICRHRVALGLSTNPAARPKVMPGARAHAITWSKEDIATLECMVGEGKTATEILPHLSIKRAIKSINDKIYKMGWRLSGNVPIKVESPNLMSRPFRVDPDSNYTEGYSLWRIRHRQAHPIHEPNVSSFIKVDKARLMAGR